MIEPSIPLEPHGPSMGALFFSMVWRDRKKRGIINILVSCPFGSYFLRAVETVVKGKKTSGAFIYRYIRDPIIEVINSCSLAIAMYNVLCYNQALTCHMCM